MPSTQSLILPAVRGALNGLSKVSPAKAGKVAYNILAKPRRPALTEAGKQFLAAAESRTLLLAGDPIQVHHWPGSGPGILLLHGWESSTARWAPYFETLRQHEFDIYAIDAPAQGGSGGVEFSAMAYAAALEAYLEQLETPPIYWLGHSAGGMAALYYLSEMNGQIRPDRLIIMGVAGEMYNFVDRFCEIVGLNNVVHAGIEHEFTKRFGMTFSDVSFVRMAGQLEMPGLIIHDRDDELAHISGAEDINRAWESSELMITEGRTHSVLGEDIPGIVAEYFLGL
ncbi:MAG: alpha/beta hydrolase [Bacteroidota bacterium]